MRVIAYLLILSLAACGKSEAPPPPAPKAAATPDFAAECTTTAAAWFKGAYGEGTKTLDDGRVTQASHQAHYNTQRKQCLARLTADTAAKDERPAIATVSVWTTGAKPSVIASVVLVRDKLTHCTVEGKKCQSKQEWEAAAGPLMKE
jgi:hypothetical protein